MNTLEKEVLRYIGEDPNSPDVFLDTDAGIEPIRDSLNDSIEEIALVSGSLTKSYPIPLIQNQMLYRLQVEHGDFAWITSAWLVNQQTALDQTDLIQLNWWNRRWMQIQATPDAYFPLGTDVVGFHPRPAASSDVVDLTCVIIPARYTVDTAPIQVVAAFRRACVHYAVSEYWASRGDANEAILEFQKYIEIVGMRTLVPNAAEDIAQFRTEKRGQALRTRDAV